MGKTDTNVDEAPELTGMDSLRHPENTPTATAVGTYTATDDEDASNGDVSLTLSGADAADFNITDGVLTFKESPNYEDPADAGTDNVYNITVVATDSDNQTDTMAVTVMVTNVDEAGTLTLSTVQPRVGTPLTATLTDIDGAVSDVVWKWERGTGDNLMDPETIMGADSATYTPTGDDDETMFLRATAMSYTDPQGSGQLAVSVVSDNPVEKDDTNKAPEFPDQDMETDGDQTDQKRMVPENTTDADIGSAVVATDLNGDDALTYTLGGTDAASFNIVTETGQLRTKAPLNKEEKDTYMVTVTATDPSGLSATVNVTIKVTNVDEAPTITRAPDANVAPEFASATTSRTVAENTAAGEDIGNPVAANDANGDALTYALSGTDAASFDIDPDTGQLMTKVALDFETKGSYTVMVTATDPRNLSATTTVTITVTNVDEGFEVSGPAAVDYAENGTGPVATYTATDPESATITWTMEGDDAALFDLSSGGMLTFKNSPDHEAAADDDTDNAYEVTVVASAGTNEDRLDVTITVTDVDETQPADFDPLAQYDADDSGALDKDEVIQAINEYLFGEGADAISKDDVIETINLYLFG